MASFQGNVILSGGDTGNTSPAFADTWQWDGTAWTQLQVNGPANCQGAMAPVGGTVVLSGFNPEMSYPFPSYNETHIWNGTAWNAFSGPGPKLRQWPAMASTSAGVLLFGGFGNTTAVASAESWLWDGATWKQLKASGPPARFLTAMASY
jgi:hypothetical protein